MTKVSKIKVYIPDTRGVVMEDRYQQGNLKIGMGVTTYSRLPGDPKYAALGMPEGFGHAGTCPGATPECQRMCYAARPVEEQDVVFRIWHRNSLTDEVPAIPDECEILRIHVGGDFDKLTYIAAWWRRIRERLTIPVWAYTRSWRIPGLRAGLEAIRKLPNVQLFASVDISTTTKELAAIKGWRRAWIAGDERLTRVTDHNYVTFDGVPAYVCPEETGRKRDCVSCGYCFEGLKHDVIFLEH